MSGILLWNLTTNLALYVIFGYLWTRLQLWSSRKLKLYLTQNKIVSQWQSCISEFWWRYRLRNISHTSISAVSQVQRRRSRMNKIWMFWVYGLAKLCIRKVYLHVLGLKRYLNISITIQIYIKIFVVSKAIIENE